MDFSKGIKIRHFREDDLDAVTYILANSFNNKFNSLINLSGETLFQLFKDCGFVDKSPFEGHIVAEEMDKVLGVMMLKWKNQKRVESKGLLSFSELCRKYGSINIIRFFFGIELLQERVNEDECYIEHIAVSPEARGLGVGTMLLNYGKEFVCKTPYFNKYTLHVASSNKNAIRLYDNLGFYIKDSKRSILTSVLFKERMWYYMVNDLY